MRDIKYFLKLLDRWRSDLLTLSGTSLVSLLSAIIFGVLILRFYTPEQVGMYGVFMAWISILGILANGQLHHAVFNYQRKESDDELLAYGLLINLVLSLVLGIFIWILTKNDDDKYWYLIPLCIALNGINLFFAAFCTKNNQFKSISAIKLTQSIIGPLLSIILSFIYKNHYGLIYAYIIGLFITLIQYFKLYPNVHIPKSILNAKILINKIKLYRGLLLYTTISEFANNISNQIPVFALQSQFGVASVGFYRTACRLLNMPVELVSGSFAIMIKSKISGPTQKINEVKGLVGGIFVLLIISGILLYSFGALLMKFPGPGIILGQKWNEIAGYIFVLIILYLPRYVCLPFIYFFQIFNRQIETLLGAILLLASIGIFTWCTYNKINSPLIWLSGFSTIQAAFTLFYKYRSGVLLSNKINYILTNS